MFKINPISAIDSYKAAHRNSYPDGTTSIYSNFTPRSVKHLNVSEKYKTDEIVWFGGQAVIKDMVELWDEEFFKVGRYGFKSEIAPSAVSDRLSKFKTLVAPFAGADYAVDHLKALHELGYLPLHIKTLPEGSRVPVGVPVMTITNTKPEFFWLTNYIETYLSAELWKMSTSATLADYYKKILTYWYDKTGANKDFMQFAAHDFSFRGMSGSLDAAKSGAGHLVSFVGTDTIPAVEYINYHYGSSQLVGSSIPASEHSVQVSHSNDYEYFKHMITKAYPVGMVSIVSDGYDYFNVLTDILPRLKDTILARQVNELGMSKVVIRPDSGDPVRIICGYSFKDFSTLHELQTYVEDSDAEYEEDFITVNGVIWEVSSNYDSWSGTSYDYFPTSTELTKEELKGSIELLWETFGGTVNEKGYKTLDSHIGLIYGDSITLERAEEILKRLEAKGFAADNVVFGVGSYSYQFCSRDTMGWAMKATNAIINGKSVELFKDPKTDTDKTKKSAKGLLAVHEVEGKLKLFDQCTVDEEGQGLLTTLFVDGQFKKSETFDEIRERLSNSE